MPSFFDPLPLGEPPLFLHHPLIRRASGQKLSKASENLRTQSVGGALIRLLASAPSVRDQLVCAAWERSGGSDALSYRSAPAAPVSEPSTRVSWALSVGMMSMSR